MEWLWLAVAQVRQQPQQMVVALLVQQPQPAQLQQRLIQVRLLHQSFLLDTQVAAVRQMLFKQEFQLVVVKDKQE
jgi:hypothetical protein